MDRIGQSSGINQVKLGGSQIDKVVRQVAQKVKGIQQDVSNKTTHSGESVFPEDIQFTIADISPSSGFDLTDLPSIDIDLIREKQDIGFERIADLDTELFTLSTEHDGPYLYVNTQLSEITVKHPGKDFVLVFVKMVKLANGEKPLFLTVPKEELSLWQEYIINKTEKGLELNKTSKCNGAEKSDRISNKLSFENGNTVIWRDDFYVMADRHQLSADLRAEFVLRCYAFASQVACKFLPKQAIVVEADFSRVYRMVEAECDMCFLGVITIKGSTVFVYKKIDSELDKGVRIICKENVLYADGLFEELEGAKPIFLNKVIEKKAFTDFLLSYVVRKKCVERGSTALFVSADGQTISEDIPVGRFLEFGNVYIGGSAIIICLMASDQILGITLEKDPETAFFEFNGSQVIVRYASKQYEPKTNTAAEYLDIVRREAEIIKRCRYRNIISPNVLYAFIAFYNNILQESIDKLKENKENVESIKKSISFDALTQETPFPREIKKFYEEKFYSTLELVARQIIEGSEEIVEDLLFFLTKGMIEHKLKSGNFSIDGLAKSFMKFTQGIEDFKVIEYAPEILNKMGISKEFQEEVRAATAKLFKERYYYMPLDISVDIPDRQMNALQVLGGKLGLFEEFFSPKEEYEKLMSKGSKRSFKDYISLMSLRSGLLTINFPDAGFSLKDLAELQMHQYLKAGWLSEESIKSIYRKITSNSSSLLKPLGGLKNAILGEEDQGHISKAKQRYLKRIEERQNARESKSRQVDQEKVKKADSVAKQLEAEEKLKNEKKLLRAKKRAEKKAEASRRRREFKNMSYEDTLSRKIQEQEKRAQESERKDLREQRQKEEAEKNEANLKVEEQKAAIKDKGIRLERKMAKSKPKKIEKFLKNKNLKKAQTALKAAEEFLKESKYLTELEKSELKISLESLKVKIEGAKISTNEESSLPPFEKSKIDPTFFDDFSKGPEREERQLTDFFEPEENVSTVKEKITRRPVSLDKLGLDPGSIDNTASLFVSRITNENLNFGEEYGWTISQFQNCQVPDGVITEFSRKVLDLMKQEDEKEKYYLGQEGFENRQFIDIDLAQSELESKIVDLENQLETVGSDFNLTELFEGSTDLKFDAFHNKMLDYIPKSDEDGVATSVAFLSAHLFDLYKQFSVHQRQKTFENVEIIK